MSLEAAEPLMEGDVSPGTSGGVIRYRLWPVKRHPVRTTLLGLGIVPCVGAAWFLTHSFFWAGIMAIGYLTSIAVGFFPTEVTLDGHTLHIRQIFFLRTWDLRRFRRLNIDTSLVPRVELSRTTGLNPLDRARAVLLPLPSEALDSELVVDHLRRWVGRQITGKFEVDIDHAPEDNVEEREVSVYEAP